MSVHGNLALKPVQTYEKQYKTTKRTVQTRKALPQQERNLYFVSLFVCGIVAFLIILNSSLIYQKNLNMQEAKQQIRDLNQERMVLQVQINELKEPKRLEEIGRRLGYSTQGIDQTQLVASGTTNGARQTSSVAVNVR
jgi:cell division protein FtsL